MIENSSPALTPKLTSVSARTPPKRSDTPRTSKAYSTHSLRNEYSAKSGDLFCDQNIRDSNRAHSGALGLGLAAAEINPVHRDGSPCFNAADTSTVALAAGLTRPAPIDFGIRECFRAKPALGLHPGVDTGARWSGS